MADQALVERARDGDPGAYEALAREIARRLYLVAHRILRDADAAEDAAQQTLVTIWRELPRLRDTERFDAWSYRIVTNAAFAEAKRRRRGREVVDVRAIGRTQADHAAQVEDREAIDRAFEQLSPEHRAVVVLRYYADLPIKEIAYALGVPPGTVGSRLHRAMAEMRAAMEEHEPPGPTGTTGREDAVIAGEATP